MLPRALLLPPRTPGTPLRLLLLHLASVSSEVCFEAKRGRGSGGRCGELRRKRRIRQQGGRRLADGQTTDSCVIHSTRVEYLKVLILSRFESENNLARHSFSAFNSFTLPTHSQPATFIGNFTEPGANLIVPWGKPYCTLYIRFWAFSQSTD